jgi:hypothetical protein
VVRVAARFAGTARSCWAGSGLKIRGADAGCGRCSLVVGVSGEVDQRSRKEGGRTGDGALADEADERGAVVHEEGAGGVHCACERVVGVEVYMGEGGSEVRRGSKGIEAYL